MSQSKIFIDIKNLAGKSAIYGLGTAFLGGITFFLLPLYTRYLVPSDYGVIAVTSIIASVLGFLYPLALHGAVSRFYFNSKDSTDLREGIGTIWLVMILSASVMTLFLEVAGQFIFSSIFLSIPFSPYIRLTIWTAFFGVFKLLPLTLLQAQERPVFYVVVTVLNTVLSIGLIISFVVILNLGVYGYLSGLFLSSACSAIFYAIVAISNVRLLIRWDIVKSSLLFSLPLVPHLLASWVLELSDRAILEKFVPLSDLGIYSLGYQFGSILVMLTTAANQAWVPFLFKTVAREGEFAKPGLARLATYYVLGVSCAALVLGLFVREAIILLTAPIYHAAFPIAIWIIAGQWLSGLYYIPANFLFLKDQTK